jgi:hypothetical protein
MGNLDWGTIGSISAVAALALSFYTHLVSRSDRLRRDFESLDRRIYWADKLKARGGWRQRYQAALKARKDKWDRFFRGSTISLPSFGFYLLVATIYPVLLAVFSYLISGQTDFAGLSLMPEATTIPLRIWWAAAPFFMALTGYLLIEYVRKLINKRPNSEILDLIFSFSFSILAIYFVTPLVTSLGYGIPIAAVSLAYFWFMLCTLISGSIYGMIQTLIPRFNFGDLTDEFTIFMLGLSITIQFTVAYALGLLSPEMLIFFVLLPIINALMDTLSWSVTRAFVDSAAKRGTTWLVLIEALIDMAFALLCLVILTVLIANLIVICELWFGDMLQITFSKLLEQTVNAPFGEGLVVTGMLLTTFIPTCIHLWDGLRGLFAAPLAGMNDVGIALESAPKEKDILPDLEDKAITMIRIYNWRLMIWGVLAIFILTIFAFTIFWGVPGFTNFLAHSARCSVAWHGEACQYWP